MTFTDHEWNIGFLKRDYTFILSAYAYSGKERWLGLLGTIRALVCYNVL